METKTVISITTLIIASVGLIIAFVALLFTMNTSIKETYAPYMFVRIDNLGDSSKNCTYFSTDNSNCSPDLVLLLETELKPRFVLMEGTECSFYDKEEKTIKSGAPNSKHVDLYKIKFPDSYGLILQNYYGIVIPLGSYRSNENHTVGCNIIVEDAVFKKTYHGTLANNFTLVNGTDRQSSVVWDNNNKFNHIWDVIWGR